MADHALAERQRKMAETIRQMAITEEQTRFYRQEQYRQAIQREKDIVSSRLEAEAQAIARVARIQAAKEAHAALMREDLERAIQESREARAVQAGLRRNQRRQ